MSKYYKETAAIKVEPSRFSALKIENDNDDDSFTSSSTFTNSKASNVAAVSTSKNKKKKQNGQSNDAISKNKQKQFERTDWDTWKQKDEEFTDELFKEHLKKALIESKLEFETTKVLKETNGGGNAKAKANKPVKMSLDQFQKSYEINGKTTIQTSSSCEKDSKIEKVFDDSEKFIQEIDANLGKLLLKDKMINNETLEQDESAEKYVNLQYKEEVLKRDDEILKLNKEISSLKTEIAEVKKRNKQLAFIMASGEMKEKSELLEQIDELTNFKNELTSQLSEMNTCYEQEKSKVHQLENELKKTKQKH